MSNNIVIGEATTVTHDKGTLSAPAFTDVILMDSFGKQRRLTARGKVAKRAAAIETNVPMQFTVLGDSLITWEVIR